MSGRRTGTCDLLERRPGKSALGDFVYEPVEIKMRPLGQARLPPPARVLRPPARRHDRRLARERARRSSPTARRESFASSPCARTTSSVLAGVIEVADGAEPPVHISSTCGECPWEPRAWPRPSDARHFADLRHAAPGRARAAPERRAHARGARRERTPGRALDRAQARREASHLVTQAQVLVNGEARWRGVPQFEEAEVELFFDIEGDPEHDVDTCSACWRAIATAARSTARSWPSAPARRRARLASLLDFLEAHPTAPIYHYHHYERSAIKPLAVRHASTAGARAGDPGAHARPHMDLVASAVLPVYSYSLKAVAKRLGATLDPPRGERGAVDVLVLDLAQERRPHDARPGGRVQRGRLPGHAATQGVAGRGPRRRAFEPENNEPATIFAAGSFPESSRSARCCEAVLPSSAIYWRYASFTSPHDGDRGRRGGGVGGGQRGARHVDRHLRGQPALRGVRQPHVLQQALVHRDHVTGILARSVLAQRSVQLGVQRRLLAGVRRRTRLPWTRSPARRPAPLPGFQSTPAGTGSLADGHAALDHLVVPAVQSAALFSTIATGEVHAPSRTPARSASRPRGPVPETGGSRPGGPERQPPGSGPSAAAIWPRPSEFIARAFHLPPPFGFVSCGTPVGAAPRREYAIRNRSCHLGAIRSHFRKRRDGNGLRLWQPSPGGLCGEDARRGIPRRGGLVGFAAGVHTGEVRISPPPLPRPRWKGAHATTARTSREMRPLHALAARPRVKLEPQSFAIRCRPAFLARARR